MTARLRLRAGNMAGKTIVSPLFDGITKDHDDHSSAATMRATGTLIHVRGEEDNARNWFVEFKCDVCKQLVVEWHADLHDIVRQALKQAGIIQL
ncbi:MAG: hypothetical protein QM756_11580 [Polyangiaceae bacterium]